MSSEETKVTKDSEAFQNPKVEGAGIVTSDSLAGESISSGGAFGSTTGAAASSQPSHSTTTNNTDTSSATVLQAAPDAEARDASQQWSETSQLNAAQGLGKTAGVGPTYATSSSGSGGQAYNTTTGSGSNVGTAPSYVINPASSTGGVGKAHGQNISEGGFDSSAPNASFNTDIGGKNDPGRAALQRLQESTARAGGDVMAENQTGLTNDGQYSGLGGDTSA